METAVLVVGIISLCVAIYFGVRALRRGERISLQAAPRRTDHGGGKRRAAEEGRSVTNYLENLIVRNGEKKRKKGG